MVGQLEDPLERAGCDALVKHLAVLLFLGLFAAFDRQRVFFRLDRKVVLAEAGYCNGNAIVVLTGALDIVGRVARSSFKTVQH